MSIQPQEIQLEGATVSLAGRRWTQGERPVLALHGWLDNAGTFDRLAPYLKGCDLVALDLPGHGYSGHRPSGLVYHFVDWIPEVFAAADSLGWEEFSLLGHSMGAGIASIAAGTFPHKISRLALIEGIGPFANLDEEAPEVLAKSILYRPSTKRRVYANPQEARKRLEARGLTSEGAVRLLVRAIEELDEGWAFTYAPEARAPSRARLSEAQVRAFLERISCPTLLIKATDGLKFPESYLEREDFVPNLSAHTLEGGHHLHLDEPERIQDQVRNFLTA